MCSGQVALPARTYRGFHSVKQQEVLLLPSGYSQGRKVVTFTGEELLPLGEELLFSGGKSCYPWGGGVVTFRGEELLPSGGKSCYPRGEELLPSGGEELLPSGGEELLPSGERVHLTLTFFSFLISLWDWNCSCHIFTRCDANCCRPSRIYHVKCVRAHIF